MKKLLLFLIIIVSVYHVHASETFVGLKAGALFSKLTSRDAAEKATLKMNNKLYVGPTAGLDMLIRFNHYIALQPELNFRMVAQKVKIGSDWRAYRLMQLEMPIMIKAGYGTDDFFVYGSFGPYVAGNVAGKDIIKISGTKTKNKIDFDKDRLQRVDVGISAGAGGMYVMKKGALDVEFRYNVGLFGQFKDVTPKKANNFWSSFALTVAYVFRTSGK